MEKVRAGLFTSASALDVGPVRRAGLAMAAWRAGVSLMVLVRGLTCDCSPKGAQHLRTIRILQADIVKKATGHIVSVGHQTHAALATKRLIAKALHDGRGGAQTLDPMVSPVKNR
jgi:hypothetical protein